MLSCSAGHTPELPGVLLRAATNFTQTDKHSYSQQTHITRTVTAGREQTKGSARVRQITFLVQGNLLVRVASGAASMLLQLCRTSTVGAQATSMARPPVGIRPSFLGIVTCSTCSAQQEAGYCSQQSKPCVVKGDSARQVKVANIWYPGSKASCCWLTPSSYLACSSPLMSALHGIE